MIYVVFLLFFSLALYIGNAAASIFLGIIFALGIKPEKTFISRTIGTTPLQIGIVILGATISLPYAWSVSASYLPWISLFVISSFFMGLLLDLLFFVDLVDFFINKLLMLFDKRCLFTLNFCYFL